MGKGAAPETHIGETFGVYTLTELMDYRAKDGHVLYKGVCNECGHEKIARYSDFKILTEKCTHLNILGEQKEWFSFKNDRLRHTFSGMIKRCYNKNNKDYRWYGAKGIKICDEWLKNPSLFEEWALNNGYEENLTIDRENENKDYCPENCRWITGNDNSKYKSTTRVIDVDGESHTGREWADVLNVSTNIINAYIREYGLDNVIEFIRRRLKNLNLKPKSNQSYYDLYMGLN